jgi:hypothetical protein
MQVASSTVSVCAQQMHLGDVTAPASCHAHGDSKPQALQRNRCDAPAFFQPSCPRPHFPLCPDAMHRCSYDFNPGVCAKLGSRSELQPADVLLWPGDPAAHTGHVVMFVKWIDQGSTYIEAACHS